MSATPQKLKLVFQNYPDGFMWVPEGPGLGMELNEEAVSKYITQGKQPMDSMTNKISN